MAAPAADPAPARAKRLFCPGAVRHTRTARRHPPAPAAGPLVTSDAHARLVAAIAAALAGAGCNVGRLTTRNLMPVTPKSSWGWVKALLHSIYDQPDATSVHAQFDRVVDALAEKLPAVTD